MKIRPERLIFFSIFSLFLAYFLFLKISPTGRFYCQWEAGKPTYFFSGRSCFGQPSPRDRLIFNDSLKIIGDPIYFSLYSPRTFNKLYLTVIFKPVLDAPLNLIEAGLLVDKNLWHYKLQPVYNYWLENEFLDWQKITEEDWSLWQKNSNFFTIDQWLEAANKQTLDCSATSLNHCLALYNLSAEQFSQITTPQPLNLGDSDKLLRPDFALRGRHSFYVYLQDGQLFLEAKLQDLNQNKDLDSIEIIVYSNNQIIFQDKWEDDRGDLETSGQVSDPFTKTVNLSSLPTALYRIDININDDIVISDLTIKGSTLSFRQRLWPYQPSDKLPQLFTDYPVIQVKVLEPAAYQELVFAGQKINLDKVFKQTEVFAENLVSETTYALDLERGGPLIEGPGVFSWSQELLFNPDYQRLDRFYNQQADFILANYQGVTQLADGWLQADLEFDLIGVYREKDKYNLILSIPGLKVEDDQGYFIELKELRAQFVGRTLKEKIKSMWP